MATRLHTINFGQAYGGLATVGFTVYNSNGTVHTARSTTGVVEFGTSTGIYGARITYPDFSEILIVWDTGGGTPRYASETTDMQLSQIQDETDHIRMIWNSLKNQGSVYQKILDAVDKNKPVKDKDQESILHKISAKLDDLMTKSNITVEDIRNAIQVKITERDLKIPNHSKELARITADIAKIMFEVGRIPKNHRDYAASIDEVLKQLGKIAALLPADNKGTISAILMNLNDIKKKIEEHASSNSSHVKKIESGISSINQSTDMIIKTMPPAQLMLMLSQMINSLVNVGEREKAQIRRNLGID